MGITVQHPSTATLLKLFLHACVYHADNVHTYIYKSKNIVQVILGRPTAKKRKFEPAKDLEEHDLFDCNAAKICRILYINIRLNPTSIGL